MAHSAAVLDILRFELKFIEDGGYGRSPRAPRRAPMVFEDSPSCLNFNDPSRPHQCGECSLMQFVPPEQRGERAPCRFIPLTEQGKTVEDFYRSETQLELEDALKDWLKKEIAALEAESARAAR